MSKPRFIMSYIYDLFFISSSIFIVINHITSCKKTSMLLFFTFFKISAIVFEWKRGWRKRIIFKEQKFSLRALLSFCLVFCHLQPGVAYKNVAYKKACIANLPHYCEFNMDIFSFLVIQSIIIYERKFSFHGKERTF